MRMHYTMESEENLQSAVLLKLLITKKPVPNGFTKDELHQMVSAENNTSGPVPQYLEPQRQEMSVENVSSGLVPQGQKASDYDNSDPSFYLKNISIQHTVMLRTNNNDQAPMHRFKKLIYQSFLVHGITTGPRDHPIRTIREIQPCQFKQDDSLPQIPKCVCSCSCQSVMEEQEEEDQTVIRNKARLVAKGYAQEEGIGF
ncbi:hypothetical protein Tco_0411135 [Tanacetum coccineum]